MMKRPTIRILGISLVLALALPLAACGEDPQAAPTGASNNPASGQAGQPLIEGVTPSDQVETETDATPQSTTGGDIPGSDRGSVPAGTTDGAVQAPAGTTTPDPLPAPNPLPAQ